MVYLVFVAERIWHVSQTKEYKSDRSESTLETHSAWLINTPGGKWDRYLRGKGRVDELECGERDRSVKNMAYRLVS